MVTALSGSGPAYFFLLAELMTDAAVKLGLPRASAQELAIQTLFGSGRMARDSDGDLARLRAEVTSKGGTTEAALRAFDAREPAWYRRRRTRGRDRSWPRDGPGIRREIRAT